MLTKILWVTAILSLMLHATTERNSYVKKEYIRCFDGQISFIQQKHNTFYSSQNNKFFTKIDASKDSCKKRYLINKDDAIVCRTKKDVLKTIKNLKSNNSLLYPSCSVFKEELNLIVSAHAYTYQKRSYYHIKYQGDDLFIPKSFIYLSTPKPSNAYKRDAKKPHKMFKQKLYKRHKKLHKKKKRKYTQAKQKRKKYTRPKHQTKKHTRVKHQTKKHTRVKRQTKKHTRVKRQIKKYIQPKQKTTTYIQPKEEEKYTYPTRSNISTNNNNPVANNIQNMHQSYTYKCLGSHGNVNISATDDNSISMASDILWRMCQKLKTGDETCTIRDCYKLIK